MMKQWVRIASLTAAVVTLAGCEVSYKAQDDAMYYTDRGLGQIEKIKHFARSRFDKDYTPQIDDLPLHLSNFDTFICDGSRQIVANFDREERSVAVAFDRMNKYLVRNNPSYPFSDGIYDLFVMQDGSLLVQKDGGTIFQHCRPLINDALKGRIYGGSMPAGGMADVAPVYQYTPTMSPAEYRSAEPSFNSKMTK